MARIKRQSVLTTHSSKINPEDNAEFEKLMVLIPEALSKLINKLNRAKFDPNKSKHVMYCCMVATAIKGMGFKDFKQYHNNLMFHFQDEIDDGVH